MSLPVRLPRWKLEVFCVAFFQKSDWGCKGQSPCKQSLNVFKGLRQMALVAPVGGNRSRNPPIQWPQAKDWSGREAQNHSRKSPLCRKTQRVCKFYPGHSGRPQRADLDRSPKAYLSATDPLNGLRFLCGVSPHTPKNFLKKSETNLRYVSDQKLQVSPSTIGCTCFPSSALHSVSSNRLKSATKLVGFLTLLSCR